MQAKKLKKNSGNVFDYILHSLILTTCTYKVNPFEEPLSRLWRRANKKRMTKIQEQIKTISSVFGIFLC